MSIQHVSSDIDYALDKSPSSRTCERTSILEGGSDGNIRRQYISSMPDHFSEPDHGDGHEP